MTSDIQKMALNALNAIYEIQTNPEKDSCILYATRHFFDMYSPYRDDFLLAYKQAKNVLRDLASFLSNHFNLEGIYLRSGDKKFPTWLNGHEACIWELEKLTLILYLAHEDKELPFEIRLYIFDPNKSSHRLLDYHHQRQRDASIYFASEVDKINMLDSDDTIPRDRSIIFSCFCAYPSKGIAEALSRNLHKNYGRRTIDEVRAEIFKQSQLIEKFGDSYLLTPDESAIVWNLDEEGIILLLDSSETSIAARTLAAQRVWSTPTQSLLKALDRNKHRRFNKHSIQNIEEFIDSARKRLE